MYGHYLDASSAHVEHTAGTGTRRIRPFRHSPPYAMWQHLPNPEAAWGDYSTFGAAVPQLFLASKLAQFRRENSRQPDMD